MLLGDMRRPSIRGWPLWHPPAGTTTSDLGSPLGLPLGSPLGKKAGVAGGARTELDRAAIGLEIGIGVASIAPSTLEVTNESSEVGKRFNEVKKAPISNVLAAAQIVLDKGRHRCKSLVVGFKARVALLH